MDEDTDGEQLESSSILDSLGEISGQTLRDAQIHLATLNRVSTESDEIQGAKHSSGHCSIATSMGTTPRGRSSADTSNTFLPLSNPPSPRLTLASHGNARHSHFTEATLVSLDDSPRWSSLLPTWPDSVQPGISPEKAATHIQACFRGFQARQHVLDLRSKQREQWERNEAATAIQKAYRRSLNRQQQHHHAQVQAICLVQARFRSILSPAQAKSETQAQQSLIQDPIIAGEERQTSKPQEQMQAVDESVAARPPNGAGSCAPMHRHGYPSRGGRGHNTFGGQPPLLNGAGSCSDTHERYPFPNPSSIGGAGPTSAFSRWPSPPMVETKATAGTDVQRCGAGRLLGRGFSPVAYGRATQNPQVETPPRAPHTQQRQALQVPGSPHRGASCSSTSHAHQRTPRRWGATAGHANTVTSPAPGWSPHSAKEELQLNDAALGREEYIKWRIQSLEAQLRAEASAVRLRAELLGETPRPPSDGYNCSRSKAGGMSRSPRPVSATPTTRDVWYEQLMWSEQQHQPTRDVWYG